MQKIHDWTSAESLTGPLDAVSQSFLACHDIGEPCYYCQAGKKEATIVANMRQASIRLRRSLEQLDTSDRRIWTRAALSMLNAYVTVGTWAYKALAGTRILRGSYHTIRYILLNITPLRYISLQLLGQRGQPLFTSHLITRNIRRSSNQGHERSTHLTIHSQAKRPAQPDN